MRVTRNTSLRAQYFLDEWLPPRLRDSSWVMRPLLRLVLKDTADDFAAFKDDVFGLTEAEFGAVYERTQAAHSLQGETDLNDECLAHLIDAIRDVDVLDVGCGRGFLASRLSDANRVTGCDILIPDQVRAKFPDIRFVDANIEHLPFDDDEFDTVVCTHTLEHVQDLQRSIDELRRVARNDLYIVVPRQRPYKYTFSLHTQFFPYRWSLEGALGHRPDATITRLGDWMYHEPDPRPARTKRR